MIYSERASERPSVRTKGKPMSTLTLSSLFGSTREKYLHTNVVINWQLSKKGTRWPVLPDRTASSSVYSSRSSIFWSYPLTNYQFHMIAGSSLFFPMIHMKYVVFMSLWPRTIFDYNIARVLALYKSYWAAMNKIFIYARPCVNKMTCSALFFVPFPKYPKIDGNDKKLSSFFWNLASF